jgi:excinuclease ABC subunit A
LYLTVDEARDFFAEERTVLRSLDVLREVGLGYLRLRQAATALSGGEAQRIKLATELQRQTRGHTLYILDEPTTGLHPADVEKLLTQLNGLVDAGNTGIVVEHTMRVVARSDWSWISAQARAMRAARLSPKALRLTSPARPEASRLRS